MKTKASNYDKIKRKNIQWYGTKVSIYGPKLLADRYDERTHFIFELLQNAEDSLARRQDAVVPRTVSFELTQSDLRISHYGDPFNEHDVKGICGLIESTKKTNDIGRFGIGFKSVYAYTDRPEVHSGEENFAIDNFVQPTATQLIERGSDETVFLIPFKPDVTDFAYNEIANCFEKLDPVTLLFLRQIEEIVWSVNDGNSGGYQRVSIDKDTHVRQVTISSWTNGKNNVVQRKWLVFSHPVDDHDQVSGKAIEIAFRLQNDGSGNHRISIEKQSHLVVFFPTILDTHLGFLVQGPYRTTPSRDNVYRDDKSNKNLVNQTAELLKESLLWLRDHRWLDVEALSCLPLNCEKFVDDSMFSSLFVNTKEILKTEKLLPCFGSGYVTATCARLATSQEMRELFSSNQVTDLESSSHKLAWLSQDITRDRAPDLYEYLVVELDIPLRNLEYMLRMLDRTFLENQPDEWIQKLYEFCSKQRRMIDLLKKLPIIRLENGNHVNAIFDNKTSVYLPNDSQTDFLTVRRTVCKSDLARNFLEELGLTEPSLVDDVIENVLPKYRSKRIEVNDEEYEKDVSRVLNAFETDSISKREKLVDELKNTRFVRVIDALDKSSKFARPKQVYFHTKRLTKLLKGVPNVLFVDKTQKCLRGKNARKVLMDCGVSQYLRPKKVDAFSSFSYEKKRKIRKEAGLVLSTGDRSITDYRLLEIEGLLKLLPELKPVAQKKRSLSLWKALGDLAQYSRKPFSGEYSWYYYQIRSCKFEASFVEKLNNSKWVSDTDGKLQKPQNVQFKSLVWPENHFLEKIIRFKPQEIDELAQKVGIQPELIEVLKESGIDSEEELRKRLNIPIMTNDKNHTGASRGTGQSTPPDESGSSIENGPDNSRAGDEKDLSKNQDTKGGSYTKEQSLAKQKALARELKASLKGEIELESEGETEEQFEMKSEDGEASLGDEEYRIIVARYEKDEGREPEFGDPHQVGWDIRSIDSVSNKVRNIEVKGRGRPWTNDEVVELSRAQVQRAFEDGNSWYLYVVEKTENGGYKVLPIENPTCIAAKWILCGESWRMAADNIRDYDSLSLNRKK